jgi:hypothetical protein
MEATREQLAKAVDGMEIVVDLTGDVVPGTWTGAKIRYPGSFASEVFARIAGKHSDSGDEQEADPQQPGHMNNREKVTRERVVAALQEFHLWIRPDHTQNIEASGVFGAVKDPELVADALLSQVSANAAHEAALGIDAELSAIIRILAELDALAGESGAGVDSANRVLTYIAGRYGYVLADED